MSKRDNPNHGNRPIDQQRAQEHNNPSPNNASGGNDRPAQTAQPLVLDQTSLEAIISGISAKIRPPLAAGGNVPPTDPAREQQRQPTGAPHEQQRQPGDTLAGELSTLAK